MTLEEITFEIDRQTISIPIERILFFKSFGNYIKIITDCSTLITKQTTDKMEQFLPPEKFIRIHKSFIVNITKVGIIGENFIVMNNHDKLPIGKTFKRYVKKSLLK